MDGRRSSCASAAGLPVGSSSGLTVWRVEVLTSAGEAFRGAPDDVGEMLILVAGRLRGTRAPRPTNAVAGIVRTGLCAVMAAAVLVLLPLGAGVLRGGLGAGRRKVRR
jgi:hypothetical protein